MIDEKRLVQELENDAKSILSHVFSKVPAYQINEFLEETKQLINNQPKINQWIPCNEKLPEEDTEVLIDTKSFGMNVAMHVKNFGFGRKKGFLTDHGFVEFDQVDAWMPLPEPYKET